MRHKQNINFSVNIHTGNDVGELVTWHVFLFGSDSHRVTISTLRQSLHMRNTTILHKSKTGRHTCKSNCQINYHMSVVIHL